MKFPEIPWKWNCSRSQSPACFPSSFHSPGFQWGLLLLTCLFILVLAPVLSFPSFVSPQSWPTKVDILALSQQTRHPEPNYHPACYEPHHKPCPESRENDTSTNLPIPPSPTPTEARKYFIHSPQIEEKIYSQNLWPYPWYRHRSHLVEPGLVKHKEKYVLKIPLIGIIVFSTIFLQHEQFSWRYLT